jgi:hypothetical protein
MTMEAKNLMDIAYNDRGNKLEKARRNKNKV